MHSLFLNAMKSAISMVERAFSSPMQLFDIVCRTNKKQKTNQIVFVVDSPSPRVLKIIKALDKRGYEIIIVCRRKRGFIFSEIKNYAYRIYFYTTKARALEVCHRYKPLVYHVFCCYRYEVAKGLIEAEIGKVVFDNYDGFAGFVVDWKDTKENRKIAAQEKFCLENADGMTCRSFETQYQKREMGYRFKGKRILFLDYCDCDKDVPEYSTDTQLSLFYGGGITENEDCLYSTYRKLAIICEKYKIPFAIYTQNYLQAPNLIKLSRKMDYFSFNKAIPYSDMKEVVKKFKYCEVILQEKYKEYIRDNKRDATYYAVKYRYGATNKFFDSIEMGIPLLGSGYDLVFNIIKRYGMAYYVTLESFEKEIPAIKKEYKKMHDNIIKNRNKFNVDSNIHRMEKLYIDIQ